MMRDVMINREIEAVVRGVTDEEVAHYQDYGWVMMRNLVDPGFASELLSVGQAWIERSEDKANNRTGLAREGKAEPFRSFMFSKLMSENAKRVVNRKRLKGSDVPLRYRNDVFGLKASGAAGTIYHQDSCEHGSDRVGELQFWLALAEVTPEMGAMRFIDRSHREGPLGSVFNDDRGDLLEQYPKLTSVLELSQPLQYQPGDCTVHHGYMVHGGPANSTDRNRWSYLFSYSPADTRYWNDISRNWGSERKRLDDVANPII